MLHQTFLSLGQLWQLFEVSQILEFLRYTQTLFLTCCTPSQRGAFTSYRAKPENLTKAMS